MGLFLAAGNELHFAAVCVPSKALHAYPYSCTVLWSCLETWRVARLACRRRKRHTTSSERHCGSWPLKRASGPQPHSPRPSAAVCFRLRLLFQRRHTRDQTGTATHRGSMSLQPVFAASAEESVEACRGARMVQEDSA